MAQRIDERTRMNIAYRKKAQAASYDGLDRISSSGMRGWFSHCGYVFTGSAPV